MVEKLKPLDNEPRPLTEDELATLPPDLRNLYLALQKAGDYYNGELIEPGQPWTSEEAQSWPVSSPEPDDPETPTEG